MIPRGRNNKRTLGSAMAFALLGLVVFLLPAERAAAQACPAGLGAADLIDHDLGFSFCELCNVGTVRIVIDNPFGNADSVDFSELVIVEDLGVSGLTYVPLSTSFSGTNVVPPAQVEQVVSGANESVLTWTLPPAVTLPGYNGGSGNQASLVLEFDVRRHPAVGEEGRI
ncbi:MAG: hypothetical protein ACR2P8_01090, partial [Myxococcota bacterium]